MDRARGGGGGGTGRRLEDGRGRARADRCFLRQFDRQGGVGGGDPVDRGKLVDARVRRTVATGGRDGSRLAVRGGGGAVEGCNGGMRYRRRRGSSWRSEAWVRDAGRGSGADRAAGQCAASGSRGAGSAAAGRSCRQGERELAVRGGCALARHAVRVAADGAAGGQSDPLRSRGGGRGGDSAGRAPGLAGGDRAELVGGGAGAEARRAELHRAGQCRHAGDRGGARSRACGRQFQASRRSRGL